MKTRVIRNEEVFLPLFFTLSITIFLLIGLQGCSGSTGNQSLTTNNNTYFGGDDGGTSGFELWKSDGTSANTVLVKDLKLIGHSNPGSFTKAGNIIFFTADDGINGIELWKYDNNTASLVKDIFPPSASSRNGKFNSNPRSLFEFNNELYFSAFDGVASGFWKSDGTEQGTIKVADTNFIRPVVFNNNIYFFGTGGLWKSDGTSNGTSLFYSSALGEITATENALYFTNRDENGRELWSTDGTLNGIQMVKDINPSGDGLPYNFNPLFPVGNTVYFLASDADGIELWKSDGTEAGTVQVKNINPGSANAFNPSSSSANFAYANNLLFFTANDGTTGNELWVSDGTNEGTRLVTDLNNSSTNSFGFSSGIKLVNFNNSIIFLVDNNDYASSPVIGNGSEIYISDGTAQGTKIIKDIVPGAGSGVRFISDLVINNELYFTAWTPETNTELWKTDGTESGTVLVKDIAPGENRSDIKSLAVIDSTLYFSADNGVNGDELWTSNGSNASTNLLADINTTTNASSYPSKPITLNGIDIFVASTNKNDLYLYRTDGTQSGTQTIIKLQNFPYIPGSEPFVKISENAYFIESTNGIDNELWKTDGTIEGTVAVKTLSTENGTSVKYFNVLNNEIYITTVNFLNGETQIWKSDGTSSGTNVIAKADTAYSIVHMSVVNDRAVFPLLSPQNGIELWVSDATNQSMKILRNINTSVDENGLSEYCTKTWADCEMSLINKLLYFIATDGSASRQLWKTDGTTTGTVLVKNIDEDRFQGGFFNSVVLSANEKLFFMGYDSLNGNEVWVSDGTEAGTSILKNIQPGNESLSAQFIPLNDQMLFFAETVYGDEACEDPTDCRMGEDLWVSDGTPTGTFAIQAAPDRRNSFEGHIVKNNKMFYSYSTDDFGSELWVTDGTELGTYMVKDVNPGVGDGISLFDN